MGATQADLQRGEIYGFSSTGQVPTVNLYKLQGGFQSHEEQESNHVICGILSVVFDRICTHTEEVDCAQNKASMQLECTIEDEFPT